MLSVGQVYRDHLLFVIFFPDSVAVGALDTFRFLLRHTQGHQVASDQMAAQRNNVETGQTAILVHRDKGDACTEVDQRTPLQFLLFRQDQSANASGATTTPATSSLICSAMFVVTA